MLTVLGEGMGGTMECCAVKPSRAQMLLLCWHFNESGEVEVERDGLDDFG